MLHLKILHKKTITVFREAFQLFDSDENGLTTEIEIPNAKKW